MFTDCDIMIYKKYILGLLPVNGTGFLKPLELPMMRVKEVSFVLITLVR